MKALFVGEFRPSYFDHVYNEKAIILLKTFILLKLVSLQKMVIHQKSFTDRNTVNSRSNVPDILAIFELGIFSKLLIVSCRAASGIGDCAGRFSLACS